MTKWVGIRQLSYCIDSCRIAMFRIVSCIAYSSWLASIFVEIGERQVTEDSVHDNVTWHTISYRANDVKLARISLVSSCNVCLETRHKNDTCCANVAQLSSVYRCQQITGDQSKFQKAPLEARGIMHVQILYRSATFAYDVKCREALSFVILSDVVQ